MSEKYSAKSVYLLYSPWKCLYSNVSCFRQFQFGWNINILLLGTIPLPCPENKIYKITGLYYAECLFMINLNWQFIEAAMEQCDFISGLIIWIAVIIGNMQYGNQVIRNQIGTT